MTKTAAALALLAVALLSAACAKKGAYRVMPSVPVPPSAAERVMGWGDSIGEAGEASPAPLFASIAQSAATADRKLIWTGELRIEVEVVSNAVLRAVHLVEQAKGYIQAQRVDEYQAQLTVRVPAAALSPTIDAFGALGTTLVVRVSSSDVSEQYVDTEARMRTARALRDRLESLLARATNVAEMLSVERELGRVQGEIEAAEARLRSLSGQVNLATLDVTLERRTPPAGRTIYGPVGLLAKGLGWILEKLWIIRE